MVRQLKGDVYWAQGGAGELRDHHWPERVIVVDAKTTPNSAKDMLAEIAKVTPKPVTHVILTHSDGDHVNGLAAFPRASQSSLMEQQEGAGDCARVRRGVVRLPAITCPSTRDQEQRVSQNRRCEYHAAPLGAGPHQRRPGGVPPPTKARLHRRHYRDSTPRSADSCRKTALRRAGFRPPGIAGLDADTSCRDMEASRPRPRSEEADGRRAEAGQIKQLVAQGKSIDEIRQAVGDPPPAARRTRSGVYELHRIVYQELTKSNDQSAAFRLCPRAACTDRISANPTSAVAPR